MLFTRRAVQEPRGEAAAEQGPPPAIPLFAPGSQARVRVVDTAGTHQSFRVLVEDVLPSGMTLRVLTRTAAAAHLPPAARLTLLRYSQRQAHATTVRLRELRDGEPALLLTSPPGELSSQPQRYLYRVDVDLRAEGPGWSGRVSDLSGSGCLLALRSGPPLRLGSLLRFSLHLPAAEAPVPVSAEVVRRVTRDGIQTLGLEFVRLTRRQQDAIVRYVYRRQAELLRQGLLRR